MPWSSVPRDPNAVRNSLIRSLFTTRKLAFYSIFHGLHVGLFILGWQVLLVVPETIFSDDP